MILTIILTCLLAVSAVSAADNATDDIISIDDASEDVVSVEETTEDIISKDVSNDVVSVEETSVDDLCVEGNNLLIKSDNDGDDYLSANPDGTFIDLANDIAGANDELNLSRNYVYSDGVGGTVSISKRITINGNGNIINCANKIMAFLISSNNVVLKNITFVGCLGTNTGGAIYWGGSNGQLLNCTFKNCQVNTPGSNNWGYGGAVYWGGSDGLLKNCNFDNCYVSYSSGSYGYGGAVYWGGSDGLLKNCNFDNCHVSSASSRYYDAGGAISWGGRNGRVLNSSFENCYSKLWGGAIYWNAYDGTLGNCSFEKCYTSSSSQNQGGAVYWALDNGRLYDCRFVDCHVLYNSGTPSGGAVYWNGYDGILSNSSFENCYAKSSSSQNYGVALFWGGVNGRLYNSSFVNCHSSSSYPSSTSSAIFWYSGEGVISNTYFNPYKNSIYTESGADDLIIIKLNSKIELNNISCKYMDEIDFKLYLKDDFGNKLGNRKIFFENKDLNILISVNTDSNGIATLPIEFTKNAGNHTIYVSFGGDDNYNSAQTTFNLNIEPLDSSVEVHDFSGTVGKETILTADVLCSNNVDINEGKVTFFDGETNIGSSNVKNGIASLNYAPNTAGKHTITAIYNSNNYVNSNNTFNFTVSKANIDFNINVATVYFTNPSNFVINVQSNSRGVNEGKIKFYIDDVFIETINIENGVARLNRVMSTAGSFNLSIVYDETDNYFGRNASTIFYVNSMPTTLSGETTFFDEEQSKYFMMELKDGNDNGVSNQTIKLEVIKYSGESKTFTNKTNENGIVTFDVSELAGGLWMIRGLYYGDDNYLSCLCTDKFIVIRMDTTTSIDEISDSHKGYPIRLHANILDEFGQKVTDGFAYYYVDGKKIGYVDLSNNNAYLYQAVYEPVLSVSSYDSNEILGACIFDSENMLGAYIPETEEILSVIVDNSNGYVEYIPMEGTHTLSVVYEGTSLYRPSNQTNTFDVQDGVVPTKLTATTISTVYNGGKYLVATLKDSWGNPISGVKVSIKINSVKTLTTDKNGQVKLSTNGLAPKAYTVTITFAGNTNYDKSTGSAKVTVTKATPKLTANAKTFKRTVKIKKYSITLKTNQNKVMKSTKVYIKVNKKTYAAKTNSKGVATFKITKLTKKGRYTAVVTYKGNAYYNKLTKKVKITVK